MLQLQIRNFQCVRVDSLEQLLRGILAHREVRFQLLYFLDLVDNSLLEPRGKLLLEAHLLLQVLVDLLAFLEFLLNRVQLRLQLKYVRLVVGGLNLHRLQRMLDRKTFQRLLVCAEFGSLAL